MLKFSDSGQQNNILNPVVASIPRN